MPSEDTKILYLSQYQNPDKASFINFEDIDGCKNNPRNSSIAKVG